MTRGAGALAVTVTIPPQQLDSVGRRTDGCRRGAAFWVLLVLKWLVLWAARVHPAFVTAVRSTSGRGCVVRRSRHQWRHRCPRPWIHRSRWPHRPRQGRRTRARHLRQCRWLSRCIRLLLYPLTEASRPSPPAVSTTSRYDQYSAEQRRRSRRSSRVVRLRAGADRRRLRPDRSEPGHGAARRSVGLAD